MSFLGYDFLSDSGAITPTTVNVSENKMVILGDGTHYELFASTDLSTYGALDNETGTFPEEWQEDT